MQVDWMNKGRAFYLNWCQKQHQIRVVLSTVRACARLINVMQFTQKNEIKCEKFIKLQIHKKNTITD